MPRWRWKPRRPPATTRPRPRRRPRSWPGWWGVPLRSSEAQHVSEARALLSAAAVRERAHELLQVALEGGLEHWRVDIDQLPDTAAFTAGVIRAQYPTLDVPFHARWRHFELGGRDLWADLETRVGWGD